MGDFLPSITISSQNLFAEGPNIEVQFLVSKDLEERLKTDGKPIPQPIIAKAQIDTGCTTCSVNESIPKGLGIEPVDKVSISTPKGRGSLTSTL